MKSFPVSEKGSLILGGSPSLQVLSEATMSVSCECAGKLAGLEFIGSGMCGWGWVDGWADQGRGYRHYTDNLPSHGAGRGPAIWCSGMKLSCNLWTHLSPRDNTSFCPSLCYNFSIYFFFHSLVSWMICECSAQGLTNYVTQLALLIFFQTNIKVIKLH